MLSTAQKNLEKEEYVDPNLAKTLKRWKNFLSSVSISAGCNLHTISF